MLTGLLEVEIKRLTKQLAAIALGETGDQEGSSSPPPLLASFLPKTHLPKTQTQASEADANSEDILYRGRRLRSKVRKILSRISP